MGHGLHGMHGSQEGPPIGRLALAATIHCLSGCAIGEVIGMIVGNLLGWSNALTVALSIGLAFVTGFALTMSPLLRAGLGIRRSLRLALAADTASIAIMEMVDNAVMLLIPGAMEAPVTSFLFLASLLLSLLLAGVVAYPFNRWMIRRGKGHAVVHAHGP
jgi:hypothetical protein